MYAGTQSKCGEIEALQLHVAQLAMQHKGNPIALYGHLKPDLTLQGVAGVALKIPRYMCACEQSGLRQCG